MFAIKVQTETFSNEKMLNAKYATEKQSAGIKFALKIN